MQLGIFTKVWPPGDLDATLRLMTGYDLRHTQFNLACVLPDTLPEHISPETIQSVWASLARHGVEMDAISGTFNLIHPDPAFVAAGLRRLAVLAAACHALGTEVITLCTGTRDPDNMWRGHPDNAGPDAWRALLGALERALLIAEAADVCLAVEPEQANVVDSARKARTLLDYFGTRRLKIIMDPANLFERAASAEIARTVAEAFDLLGPDIVLAHAKDRDAQGRFVAAGQGVLDYDHYLGQLRRIGFDGALVLHGLTPTEVAPCVRFLRSKLDRA